METPNPQRERRIPSVLRHLAEQQPEAMQAASLRLRPATASDQNTIVALVRNERLNPHGLHWARFTVATARGQIVGAAQVRHHADGSRELGSLVVAQGFRGQGIAGRLIGHLLAQQRGPVHVITARGNVHHYAPWGLRPVEPCRAPLAVRRNYQLGQLASLIALARGRLPRRLAVLVRG
jgi:amino-acid N-acetyltransferase